ncbi:TonB-dependent receptor plug domain-containing protein [Falsigemmobacter faecalis]|uniref:TonB-dependent receptor n=1 Tax=Falsigemmobacter faecalis TaxID=2488730 RepID=A0A3P3DG43_9RHOB|nr:TonB-dependent receptor [Falsigemmobacter faecalis]RRH72626.1 TonB-dependent receptor [Falsigemmobacter faecalis]
MKREGFFLLAALLAGTAAAEDVYLSEITLTAARTPREVSRSGVSVSVITGEELARAGDIQLVDYLARLPGLSASQSGPEGTHAALRIRGADPRHIAVFVDGVKVNDPSGIGGEFDFGALSTADIGRVEVLRGAQGALWGSQAMGGVIHITTRGAEAEGHRQTLAAEAGSRGTRALRYSSAWREGEMETVFHLSHRRSAGFSAMDTLPRSPGAEADGFETNRLSFSTRYAVSESLRLGASGFVQKMRFAHDNDSTVGMNAPDRSLRREHGASLFAELEAGQTAHRFELGAYDIDRKLSQSGSNFATRRSFNWQAVSPLHEGLSLVYGLEAGRETAGFGGVAASDETRSQALWGQALWSPIAGLDLTAGLRRDAHSRYGGHTTGRLAFAFAASDALTLRGVVASGFLSPSLYQLYGDEWVLPNPGLTPETSRSYELGFDLRRAGGSLGLTLFRLDSDNAIIWDVNAPFDPAITGPQAGYLNAPGRSRREGLELSAALALSQSSELQMAYSYTEARDPQGARPGRVPRHTLSLGLTAALTPALSVNADLRAVAGRPEDSGQRMGSYALASAGLGYALTDETRLSLRVENLFDRQYQTVAGYGTPGRGIYLGLSTRF